VPGSTSNREAGVLKKTVYWVTTILVSLAYLAGGYMDVAQPEPVVQGAALLGYPLYFFTILGFWKLGAVVVLLCPGTPRLKEWAYAGLMFNLTGASVSHYFVGDPVSNVVTPMVILAIVLTSWALRPVSRKLPGPWL
jgi:hypothetical protein